MSDPIADMLTRVRNAQAVKRETVKIPYSNFDFAVAELLAKFKFLDSVSKKGRMPKRVLEAKLKYDDGQGALHDFKFLSKPSRRLYSGHKELRPVRQGFGLLVVSTPKGVMDGKTARKQKLGGQLLFEVW